MSYLLITSFVWAFSYGLIKTQLGNLDANFITFCRMLCGCAVFLPFLRLKTVSWQQTLKLGGIGAIQYGIMYLCVLRSYQYLAAHQVALFTTMTPVYVILVNDCYNREFNKRALQIALLAVFGGAIIYLQNLQNNNLWIGFCLVQVADLCFAFGQVAYKRLRTQAPRLSDVEVYAVLFFGALITAGLATTYWAGWNSMAKMSLQQFWVLIYLGTVASGVCFFLWNKGAVLTNTTTLAVFNNLKSPLAIAVSLVFFQETADLLRLIIGVSIIGLALFWAESQSPKTAVATLAPPQAKPAETLL